MNIDIPSLKPEVARSLVRTPEGYDLNWRMYHGDHWLDGDGYIGPKPGPGEPGADVALNIIRQGFVSRNVIKEVVKRRRGGAIDAPPVWRFGRVGSTRGGEGPDKELQMIHDELTLWWNRRKVHKTLKMAVRDMLLGERSVLRLVVPPGRLKESSPNSGGATYPVMEARSLREALDLIFVDALPADRATVVTDDSTKNQLGVYAADQNVTELTYLNGTDTVLRTVGRGVDNGVTLRMGGRLTMHEMECDPFITPQVRQMQMAYNFALSTLPRNIASAAFLERILTNAQLPGKFELDARGKPTGRFIPEPFITGAGSTQFVQGTTYKDSDGKTHIATPGVHFRQPAEVRPIVESKRSTYADILEECGQAHVLLNSSELPSGTSRDQARADFKTGLEDLAGEMNDAGTWLLEAVLALAEHILDTPGKWTGTYNAEFITRINTGPLSTEEQQNVLLAVERKVISPETAMDRLQIPDTDAERRRIENDPLTWVKIVKEKLDVLAIGIRANMDQKVIAEMIGIDPKVAARLVLPLEPEDEDDDDEA